MCACILSTRTSTLVKNSFTLGYQEGRAAAVGGLEARPLTAREVKRAVDVSCACRCSTARQARKFIAQAHKLGYRAGYADLFADEVAARGPHVVAIEDLRAARIARATASIERLVVGD